MSDLVDETYFYTCLNAYLATDSGTRYASDVVFTDTSKNKLSYFR